MYMYRTHTGYNTCASSPIILKSHVSRNQPWALMSHRSFMSSQEPAKERTTMMLAEDDSFKCHVKLSTQ